MIKFYYLSNSDLKYRKFGGVRLLAAIALPIILSSVMTIFMVHRGFDPLGFKNLRMSGITRENSALKTKLASLNMKLDGLQNYMENFEIGDSLMRISENMPPISSDVRRASIGGVEMNSDYGVSPTSNKLISAAAQTLDALSREAKLQEESDSDILKKHKTNQMLFAHIPAIDPIRAGIVTDGFGMRYHPILHVRLMHEGIDIEAPRGTAVHATGDGVVSYVGRRGGYGNVVEIDHGFGYVTLYGHLEKSLVREGEKVKRGDVIALSGSSGLSTGPHLHYGITKNGIFVDPSEYYFQGSQYDAPTLYGILPPK